MEALCKSARRVGLDTTKSLKRQKSIGGKPLLRALGSKRLADVSGFSLAGLTIQTHEKIWPTKVAIVFGDFIFQNEMAAEGIPGQLGDHFMVLVKIVTVMGKNQIWSKSAL